MEPHPLAPLADQLDPDTEFLLRAVRGADPSLQALALNTAPAATKHLLRSHQLAAGEPDLRFTALGLALIEFLPRLTTEERVDLARRVDELLSR